MYAQPRDHIVHMHAQAKVYCGCKQRVAYVLRFAQLLMCRECRRSVCSGQRASFVHSEQRACVECSAQRASVVCRGRCAKAAGLTYCRAICHSHVPFNLKPLLCPAPSCSSTYWSSFGCRP